MGHIHITARTAAEAKVQAVFDKHAVWLPEKMKGEIVDLIMTHSRDAVNLRIATLPKGHKDKLDDSKYQDE